MKTKPSQSDLVLEHFKKFPNQELSHSDWIDIVTKQYEELTGNTPRDLWRAARKLHQSGYLVKVKKGIYKYDPAYVRNPDLEEFTAKQKQIILERDNYRCVICGRGKAEGVELHIDHIKPKDSGGKATIENGQTLCAQHNLIKKNLKATETGKKMFVRLYELAKEENNDELLQFCYELLAVYEKFNINGHIDWEK